MLTQLRFKNWRSLRDVTIDNLTPLTVFIGANSSGKTNIVDGLRFLQECTTDRPIQAILNRGGAENILTRHQNKSDPIVFEAISLLDSFSKRFEYALKLRLTEPMQPDIAETLLIDRILFLERPFGAKVFAGDAESSGVGFPLSFPMAFEEANLTVLGQGGRSSGSALYPIFNFITERWQLLDEGFKPPLSVLAGRYGDISLVERDAGNLPIMLQYLKGVNYEKYLQMQDDLRELLNHVEGVISIRDERETRFYVEERFDPGREAPTISAGTARIVAMLTAYYALDIGPRAKMPGLVVIEEPDTAMNPGLLQRFVDLLRRYVREGNRQFILTTHNPSLLNYFQPEEVRVVSRDENGDTTVQPVPAHIRDIWLTDDAEYGLGEVWTTNVFGGLPK